MSLKNYVIPLVVFMALANPGAFKVTRRVLGGWFANAEGAPSFPGLFVHGFIFVMIVGFLMRRVSRYATADQANDRAYLHFQENRFVA